MIRARRVYQAHSIYRMPGISILKWLPNWIKIYFPDDIKEEEMEIEAFDYDDDFENDPSFTISSDLENRQFDEDELEDFTVDDSDLDEPRDTPRKRRRKVQEHETYKSFK